MLVFDLDGVLISTRQASKKAYHLIGVEPPENFHTIGWAEWTDKATHDAKNEAFVWTAKSSFKLPLWDVAVLFPCVILSACSLDAYNALLQTFPINRLTDEVHIGLTNEEKVHRLSQLGSGAYFDDSLATIELASSLKGWQLCHVRS